VVATVPVFRALLPTLSRYSGVQVHSQICQLNFGPLQLSSRTHLPGEGLGVPLSWMECTILMKPQIVGIKDSPVPKTDRQETENLDKAISLDQEYASMSSLPLNKHAST
jgi:hypothetical protein